MREEQEPADTEAPVATALPSASLAHDLNNALAVVISSLGLIKRRLPEGEGGLAALADAALGGAERAAALAEALISRTGTRDAKVPAAHAELALPMTPEALAGGIAHEFNNLLGIIGASLEMAEASVANTPALAHVTRARDAVRLGASLNRRLLSLAGRAAAKPRRIDVATETAALLRLIERSLGDKIRVSADLATDLWPTLADPASLEGALLSLVVNARDAMPEGGTLAIVCRNATLTGDGADIAAGDYVSLSLADTGHGMAPDVLERCTVPYFTTRAGRRTGLGLASVRSFCAAAGGGLRVESEQGSGTTVTLLLPRTAQSLAHDSSKGLPAVMGDGELILVVEDDDALREITLGLVESLGYAAIGARTAPEALALLDAEPTVVLVISDIALPDGMTGHDIARWLGVHRASTRILLTSGTHAREAEATGTTLLVKPYSRLQLAEALHAKLMRTRA